MMNDADCHNDVITVMMMMMMMMMNPFVKH